LPNFRSKKIERRAKKKTLPLTLRWRKKKVSCRKQIQSFYTPENPRAVARFFNQEDFSSDLKPRSVSTAKAQCSSKLEMDVKPTLKQAWAADKPLPAICVQNVDVHVSCSSHNVSQLAAFFIDP